jgi:peptide/nickel transport system substrate-binding protein
VKRISVALSVLVMLSFLLAACAPATPAVVQVTVQVPVQVTVQVPVQQTVQVPVQQTVQVVVTPTAAPTAAPKKGGTLIAARAADAQGLDPHKQTAFSSFRVMELIFDTLVTLDKNLNVVPSLAESWSYSTDGLTLTMKIRQNVKFHNGDLMSSADVKFSYERILDEKTAAAARSNFTGITSIDAPDASTVVFHLKAVNASLLAAMTTANAAILDQKWITGGGDPAKQAIGTGPFKVNTWDPNKSLILDANKDYWVPGLPYLDHIDFRTIPDEASILAGLRAGTIDWALINDPRIAITAGSVQSKLNILRVTALAYNVLQLNATRPVFKDQLVRQALSCAIDRQQVLDTAALGEGVVTGPATAPAYQLPTSGLTCYKQDVAKAKDLLTQSGAKNVTFTIIAAADEPPTAVAEAQNIQAQLKAIGVTANIQTLELGVYVQRWLAGDFDAAVALNGGNPDPNVMFFRYWSSTGNLNKVAGFSSPDIDTLLNQGQVTLDPAARKTIYAQVQTKLVDAAPWIWLYTGFEYRIEQPYVKGFIQFANGADTTLAQTWLDK